MKREKVKQEKACAKAVGATLPIAPTASREAEDKVQESSVGTLIWSWAAVGGVVLFLLGSGIAFMTSGHSTLAYLFYVLGAVLFLLKVLTCEETRTQPVVKRRLMSAAGCAATLLVTGVAIWGNFRLNRQAFIVHPQFKETSLLTQSRQDAITRDVNGFIAYLVSVGFKVPFDIPSIGVRNTQFESYTQPSQIPPEVSAEIDIQASRVNERNAILEPLADWLFHQLFPRQVTDPKGWFDDDAARLYASYYTASFSKSYNKPTRDTALTDWQNALWDLRTRYGAEFVDRLLYDAQQLWMSPQPTDTFDSFFWSRFQAGLVVVDNNAEHDDGVLSIMKAYRLPREQPK